MAPALKFSAKMSKTRSEVQHELASLIAFEVDTHASFVEVVAKERGANGPPFGIGHCRQ